MFPLLDSCCCCSSSTSSFCCRRCLLEDAICFLLDIIALRYSALTLTGQLTSEDQAGVELTVPDEHQKQSRWSDSLPSLPSSYSLQLHNKSIIRILFYVMGRTSTLRLMSSKSPLISSANSLCNPTEPHFVRRGNWNVSISSNLRLIDG
jgi:hypothetical protein